MKSKDYLFQFIQTKITIVKDLKLENTFYQKTIKNYNIIINGKNFYDQIIDSDIKRYEEIRKLTTGQGEGLLDYDYIKNHYGLIAVDLNRQKKLDANPKAIQKH